MAGENTVDITLSSRRRRFRHSLDALRRIAAEIRAGRLRWHLRVLGLRVAALGRRGGLRGLAAAVWRVVRRNPWRVLGSAAIAGLVVGAVLAMTFISVPYYALHPGDVYSATGAVSSDSEMTYEPMSLIGFVTVSAQRVDSLWQWVGAYLDPAATLQHEDVFNRGMSPQERRNTDARLMTRSQDVSVYVALRELGYELPRSEVVVSGVIPCMPAADHIAIGDVITEVGGVAVTTSSEVSSAVRSRSVGEVVPFGIRKEGEAEGALIEIRLGSSADPCIDAENRTSIEDERPLLGVILGNDVGDLAVDIDFATGNIAGPSAGLAFALSVTDLLSPGELTEGTPVAVTGTISPDGSVGTVGGIAQKVVAAERRNFRLMLVPDGQFDEASAAAGDSIEIVEVSTMAEALEAVAPNWTPPLG